MSCQRLSLWSGPRNVSTALMYSFRQRRDCEVVDEPLYGHYLRVSGAKHPGRERVLAAMDQNGERVVRAVLLGPCGRPLRLFKNMAHHLAGLERGFLKELRNVLLTRDPAEMLPSLAQQLPEPTLRDTGLEQQLELLDVELALGREPLVLDARELLTDPEGVLAELCRRLSLPFETTMLSWPPGPRPEDGVWAEHWYHNVHRSRGFEPYRAKTEPFPARLEPLLERCRPLYARLREHAIPARAG